MVIANNFLFEWSACCCLDSRWKLFIYLWFQGDDESLIDSQTIITGQILDNNTQRLTIENILLARQGPVAEYWLSDLVAMGHYGSITRRKLSIRLGSGAQPHVSYEWGMVWGRCQVIIPIGEAEREKNRQKERINSSCWLQCAAWSYLFVPEWNVELIYFLNSDQRVATLLHGGELEKGTEWPGKCSVMLCQILRIFRAVKYS